MTNILIVEDEDRIADFIGRGLKGEGWTTTRAGDGESALDLLVDNRFDVVLLDLMLPGMSGHDVCSRMRMKNDFTPILMLTAMDDLEARITGLNRGADDYLAKPFEFDELIARINALVRREDTYRSGTPAEDDGNPGDAVVFEREATCLVVDGERVDLTAKERDFIAVLMANPGRTLSRERILNAVWGLNEDPMTNTVDVYVRRLRGKLGKHAARIASVRGVGYRYD